MSAWFKAWGTLPFSRVSTWMSPGVVRGSMMRELARRCCKPTAVGMFYCKCLAGMDFCQSGLDEDLGWMHHGDRCHTRRR